MASIVTKDGMFSMLVTTSGTCFRVRRDVTAASLPQQNEHLGPVVQRTPTALGSPGPWTLASARSGLDLAWDEGSSKLRGRSLGERTSGG